MRVLAGCVIGLALAACGQPASTNGEAAAQASGAGGGGEAAFVEACVERYAAGDPQARRWAPDQCAQDWQNVVAAGPMAEAILAAAGGTMPSAGRMGNLDVTREGRTVTFAWSAVGEMIPYDVIGALSERGAPPSLIGCSQVGTGEFNKAYSVAPEAGSSFQLNIYERTAPTANASSFYNVSADLSGRVQTRAQLASDGMEWSDRCAY